MNKKTAGALVGAAIAVVLFLADNFASGTGATPDPTPSAPPSATPTATTETGPTVPPSTSRAVALRKLAELEVRNEDTGHHYRREDWPHWTGVRGSCDTRETILQRDGRRVDADEQCRAVAGRWVSTYDRVTVTDSGALDIDHIVPLKEASRSGTREWTRAQREAFANDPANLVAVSATSNRQKSDSDPARWRPPMRGSWCWYATAWIDVKHNYGLTVDVDEAAAVKSMLNHCRKPATTPTRRPTGVTATTTPEK